MASKKALSHDAFIAYAHKDKQFVERVVMALRDHQITVWIDKSGLSVGDQFRSTIEYAIEACEFFCIVVSPASMSSFFVQKLEIEAAFAKMTKMKRESFILPILWKYKGDLPLMLSTFQYLDFSNSKHFISNINELVRKIKRLDEHFTGARIYKNVDTAFSGQMVGVGEINRIPHHGTCVRLFFENGRVLSMETYTDGMPDGAKRVVYDEKSRVSEITLFRNNKVVDTWTYIYDPRSGLRQRKLIHRPGERPHTELMYDRKGNRIREIHLAQDGKPELRDGAAVKEWKHAPDGIPTLEIWKSVNRKEIRRFKPK